MSFPEWAIGVILVTVGSLGNNLGSNLVSLGHAEKDKAQQDIKRKASVAVEEQIPQVEDKKKATHVFWRYFGTFIFVFGNLFTFASFGFGAQSLLASLESIQFVSNVIFARYVHNETITFRMCFATAAIVVGNVLVVVFAEHHAILYNSDGMIHLYVVNSAYHGYLVAAFIVCVVTNWIYLRYYNSRMKERKLLWRHNFVEPFCFSVSSAIVGTQAVLNSKCMSMLIQVSARERNEFTRWYIYFILVTWILLVAFWLRRLDKGFELFPPLFIIPVMQVFFVFFAILCGGIYFEEFNGFGVLQWCGFIIGVALILSGVYGLAPTDMVLKIPDLDEGELVNKDADLEAQGNGLENKDNQDAENKVNSQSLEMKLMKKEQLLANNTNNDYDEFLLNQPLELGTKAKPMPSSDSNHASSNKVAIFTDSTSMYSAVNTKDDSKTLQIKTSQDSEPLLFQANNPSPTPDPSPSKINMPDISNNAKSSKQLLPSILNVTSVSTSYHSNHYGVSNNNNNNDNTEDGTSKNATNTADNTATGVEDNSNNIENSRTPPSKKKSRKVVNRLDNNNAAAGGNAVTTEGQQD